MSIFRNTFTETVRTQLTKRQEIVKTRTPQSVQLTTSRAPWVRMTSGVNTLNVNTNEFDATLANQNILLGGVLDSNKKLKYSVGSTGNEAYSNRTSSGKEYQRGLRPMPGITSVDVKSKSAYGSLREVTVNFVCHDIKQLEDLEVLYMRPGYTVLVEWGWLPYLNNDGNVVTNIDFYDDVLNGKKDFQTILLELFQKSKTHSGNYDAVYGKVQNYSWQARMDGGYDCTTTIITMGEVLESLKVNTTPFDVDLIEKDKGLLFKNSIKNTGNLKTYYTQNYLAGLLHELQQRIEEKKNEQSSSTTYFCGSVVDGKNITYDFFAMDFNTTTRSAQKQTISNLKTYITLDSLLSLINNYIIIGAGTENKLLPFTKLSTYSNTYETEVPKPLLCLSHPLQVSVDVNVCLITNDIFANGFDLKLEQASLGADNGAPTTYETSATEIYKQYRIYLSNSRGLPDLPKKIAKQILDTIGVSNTNDRNNAEQNALLFLTSYLKVSGGSGLGALKEGFNENANESEPEIKEAIDKVSNTLINQSNIDNILKDNAEKTKTAQDLASGEKLPFNKVVYLEVLNNYQESKKYQAADDYGVIGNIYISLEKLIESSTNYSLTTSEKREIKLYDFVKFILREIQESTGNINNFDIHVDPIDSIARIIDINYVDEISRTEAFKQAFELKTATTSGTVRSYTLQSQIFPEQSSIVAIGAQIKGGGEQGSDNNTLLSFNKGIQDRIIPVKLDQTKSNSITLATRNNKISGIISNILILQEYFFPPQSKINKVGEGANTDLVQQYKNALKDTIKYIQGITNANSKNRSIIPVKLSLTMDGIGGLVIGHLFKFPDNLLPQGYKFTNEDKGVRLLQTVIGLGHKIDSTGWTTTIEAYNMVLNEPEGEIKWNDFLKSTPRGLLITVPTQTNISPSSKGNINAAVKFFLSKGYKDYQVAAILGSLIQESDVNPTASDTDSTGTTYGIAQWRGPRQAVLRQKSGFDTLNTQLNFIIEEFAGSERIAGNALKNSSTFEQAVVAMAKYERFYDKGYNVTFENLSRDYSRRVSLSQNMLTRIKSKEFSQPTAPLATNLNTFIG